MTGIRLINQAPVIFSASAATAGGHGTLAYVPGSALWGRMAATFYGAQMASLARLSAVHSGALRISPGFPVTAGGAPAFPMPQCLRQPKHDESGHVKDRLTAKVWNLAHRNPPRAPPGDAGEAIKRAFVSADGLVVRPLRESRGKTANQPGGRRSEESQFFQYEHLAAGQSWIAWVSGDPADAAELAMDTLCASGNRFGRSRLKEFGGGFLCGESEIKDPRTYEPDPLDRRSLVLWCLSDVACVDASGAPDLAPSLETLLGAPCEATLDMSRSAITSRRYAPFNGFFAAHDREHAVIEAGSVLVYRLNADPPPVERFREGVGLWRERGLGMIWPNPPLLREDFPGRKFHGASEGQAPVDSASTTREEGDEDEFADAVEAPGELMPVAAVDAIAQELLTDLSPSEKAVLAMLGRRRQGRMEADFVDQTAARIEREFRDVLADQARVGGVSPTATQWANLAELARTASDLTALNQALFDPKTGACSGDRNLEWGPFHKALAIALKSDGDHKIQARGLERAAWRLRALAQDA
jgi:hypothetical protein